MPRMIGRNDTEVADVYADHKRSGEFCEEYSGRKYRRRNSPPLPLYKFALLISIV